MRQIASAAKNSIGQTSVDFLGCSFGRYDCVIEFRHKSPRVASWKTIQVRKELEALKEHGKGSLGQISCSMSLCRRLTTTKEFSDRRKPELPLTAYVFMKPRTRVNQQEMIRLVGSVDTKDSTRIFWNTSSYSLLLSMKGSCYHDLFLDLMHMKQEFPQCTTETCSFFALEWDSATDDFRRDTPKGNTEKVEIYAITNVKLKGNSDPKFKICHGDWTSIKGSKWLQFRRLGWLDDCLFTKKPTLRELLQSLSKFREDNKSVVKYTTTVLLSPVRK